MVELSPLRMRRMPLMRAPTAARGEITRRTSVGTCGLCPLRPRAKHVPGAQHATRMRHERSSFLSSRRKEVGK